MKKLLILGGTNFIGRNLVERLIELNSYSITLFNRGKTNGDLFPKTEKIIGDRNTQDTTKLCEQQWDCVIDLSCYFPDSIEDILSKIESNIEKYILVSSCSVYDSDTDKRQMRDEGSLIVGCTKEESIDESVNSYGNRKARSEQILIDSGINHTILRPALVYGKYDDTDRFYYWLYQLNQQPEFLVPNAGISKFSVTYVEDLVKLIIQSIDSKSVGIYNAVSTPQCSIESILNVASKELNCMGNQLNVTPEFLHNSQVVEWVDVPLWIDSDHFTFTNYLAAKDFNFSPTDFDISIQKTIEYFSGLNWPEPKYGIEEKVKINLIKDWKRS